jgi:hypothetical protein
LFQSFRKLQQALTKVPDQRILHCVGIKAKFSLNALRASEQAIWLSRLDGRRIGAQPLLCF